MNEPTSEGQGQLMVQMRATGTVHNPDGTKKEIELRAQRPMTETERAKYEAQQREDR